MLADLSGRFQGTLSSLASAAVYEVATTIQAKAAVAVPAGSTSLSLTGGPALVGDTFTAGGTGVRTVTEADGAAVTFTPATTSPIAAGAAVPLARVEATPVLAWVEGLDIASASSTLIAATDTRICVLADAVPVTPAAGHRIVIGGSRYTVKAATSDAIGAVWRLVASR